jgi:hypothetical protein
MIYDPRKIEGGHQDAAMRDQERQHTPAGDGGKVEIGSRAALGRRREQSAVRHQVVRDQGAHH